MATTSGPAGPKRHGEPRASLAACLQAITRVPGEEAVGTWDVDSFTADVPETLRVARQQGVRCRLLRPSWDALTRLGAKLPAVVTFKDGSCLILSAVRETDGTAVVVLTHPHGDGTPPLEIDRIRFERVWTGELVLVRRPVSIKPFGLRIVAAELMREPRLLRDGIAASLALSVLAVAPILIVQLLMGRVLTARSGGSGLILIGALLVILAIEAVFRGARAYVAGRLAAHAQARLDKALFDRLLELPLGATASEGPDALRHRFAGLGATHAALAESWPRLLLDAGVLAVTLPLLVYLDPLLSLAVLALLAPVLGGLALVMPTLRERRTALSAAQTARDVFVDQTMRAMPAIKTLAIEDNRLQRWTALTATLGEARLAEARLIDRVAALALPAERVLVFGTLLFAIALPILSGDTVPLPALTAVVLLIARLMAPLPSLAGLMRTEAQAAIASAGVSAVLAHEPEPKGQALPPGRGAFEFDGVTFGYPSAVAPAVHAVSVAVPAGTTLGITGPSGAGKTTLIRLLQRLFEPEGGIIRLDGSDIRELDPSALRRAVAVLPQSATILAGTVRETITAGRPDASFDEMARAARIAGAEEFIERLPRGFETHLAAGAPALSAGQRQRLALARALLTRPRVLVLDEALSALDADIEAKVEANLRQARHGLTTVIVSHRLAALRDADQILVMAEGGVCGLGPHEALLETCEPYRAAWARQNGRARPAPAAGPLLAIS